MHPDATIRYHSSRMVLYIHSDSSYISAPHTRNKAGGHFFLGDKPQDAKKPEDSPNLPNSSIHSVCELLCNVMASAAKVK
eukprot:3429411-Ditylum_brightwellii.AAC.1